MMRSTYPALLATFLLAAGCGEMAYEDFAEEKAEIESEIRAVCAAEEQGSFYADESFDDCHWFQPARGARCLDRLDAALDAVL